MKYDSSLETTQVNTVKFKIGDKVRILLGDDITTVGSVWSIAGVSSAGIITASGTRYWDHEVEAITTPQPSTDTRARHELAREILLKIVTLDGDPAISTERAYAIADAMIAQGKKFS